MRSDKNPANLVGDMLPLAIFLTTPNAVDTRTVGVRRPGASDSFADDVVPLTHLCVCVCVLCGVVGGVFGGVLCVCVLCVLCGV